MSASGKGKEQKQFLQLQCQEQWVKNIPYYFLGLSPAHFFRQPFSKQLYILICTYYRHNGYKNHLLKLIFPFSELDQVYMVDLKLRSSQWREEYRMSNSSQFLDLATEIEQGVSFMYSKIVPVFNIQNQPRTEAGLSQDLLRNFFPTFFKVTRSLIQEH